jgi:CheY-like chemotaxis protein
MDIELPEMKGVEASAKMREVENEYENIHTNIIAVTVSANIDNVGVIDNICKNLSLIFKPIISYEFIKMHTGVFFKLFFQKESQPLK